MHYCISYLKKNSISTPCDLSCTESLPFTSFGSTIRYHGIGSVLKKLEKYLFGNEINIALGLRVLSALTFNTFPVKDSFREGMGKARFLLGTKKF